MTVPTPKSVHEPVLLRQALNVLSPRPKQSYLDLTAGYGGHATAVLEMTGNYKDSVLVDQDKDAVEHLTNLFDGKPNVLLHSDFLNASQRLAGEGRHFDLILADLGVSSLHLDNAARGFALSADGPLDMRMDQRQDRTAAEFVNEASEEELIRIIREFGEEPKAKTVARAIVKNRPVKSTRELSEIAGIAWKHSRRHPATRTFQALRIAVNDELGQLTNALPIWLELLAPGGRLAVISFHSLEDRIVKTAFREATAGGYDAEYKDLSKRPIRPSADEIVNNPRSRSAKLRAVAKIKNERK